MRLLQSDYDKEAFYAQVGSTLYYSSDFGETFECTTSIHSDIFDCSKFDSKVLVYSTEYLYIEEYHYIISHDSGQTQSTSVENFMITHDIAFHYSDPNKILLIGNKIVLSEDGGKTWQHLTYSKNELDCIDRKFKFEFSKSGSDRLYITDNNLLYYSDDYGVTWNELYELDLEEGDKIEDFLQHSKMIYSYTSSGKIYQMNLEELEASVEAIGVGSENVSVKVEGNNLRINSQSEISSIEIYSIGGIKLLSQKYASDGINISDLLQGIYIARLQTVDGRSLSVKFNK